MILTRSPALAYLNKVIVVEVTSTIRGIPQEVRVGRREGLARPSVVNLDNIHVIATSRLGESIGSLDGRQRTRIKRALGYASDWPELKVLGDGEAELSAP